MSRRLRSQPTLSAGRLQRRHDHRRPAEQAVRDRVVRDFDTTLLLEAGAGKTLVAIEASRRSRQESNSSRSSRRSRLVRLWSSVMRARARSRLASCNWRIFSSTVSSAINR